MKKENRNLIIGLAVGVAVVILIIIFYNLIQNTNQPVANNINLETNSINIQGWKITPGYIQIAIQNTGQQDYDLSKISIDGCGISSGGILPKGYQTKTFNIVCDTRLTEGSPFIEKATISYNLLGVPTKNSTWETTISGNVLQSKCFYMVTGESIPYASGTCQTKMDCINHVSDFLRMRNEEQKINNKPPLTTNDISVLDCEYA